MEKLNVVCVDDQREVLSAVLQDLEPLHQWLNIEDCESAGEVLELMDELDAEGEMIALIISDHVMPGKTGVELLTEVSQDSRFVRTRKVLLTGQATHTDTINAINSAGIDRYFEKPWQASQLIECVRNLVTQYIFDMGLDYTQYHEHLDQSVVFERLR
ncbi:MULTISPECIES: response regulator [Vibrio diabolicus subgroup]|uniref:response regulator n=1 Tax=Vibrio diabolicus subgroup TaxID=2315253 RepID=UPI001592C701|nr:MULTISPECIES: response regulator [Vibrio diabolicus subgroup]MCR9367183.1 response regulator [Vibrio antiquarius]NVC52280.1 response regulator [Vibrio diabolicus]